MKLIFNCIIGFYVFFSNMAFGLQDPTRPVFYAENSNTSQRHVLSAIITNNARRLAMIDGQLIKEGGMLGGSKVVRIDATRVFLKSPSGTEEIALQRVRVKLPASGPVGQRSRE